MNLNRERLTNKIKTDFLIIGAGIIGLTIAKELKTKSPQKSIVVIEKEPDVAHHSSGRNSGVLHAGFYYTVNSLKAKFTKNGCLELRKFCEFNNLKINKCQKVVVATSENEVKTLYELERRGKENGVEVRIIDENELNDIDPNIVTYKKALFSPNTATVDPLEVCNFIKNDLINNGVVFHFNKRYIYRRNNFVHTNSNNTYEADKIINCAGLYADKIAKDFGFSKDYTIIPFKGLYLKYTGRDMPIRINVYPVPNLRNPFLGVHYTITVDGTIKIGPTAIPSFWRENYQGFSNFKLNELLNILGYEAKLLFKNSFNFRSLALNEMKKYNKKHLISLAAKMVKKINFDGFTEWSRPGIRAQLLNTNTMELVQDFIVEGDKNSTHILNAVSPAFTSSFPFSRWVVAKFIK